MRLLTMDEERAGKAQGITRQTRYRRSLAVAIFLRNAVEIRRVAAGDEVLIVAVGTGGKAYLMHWGEEPRLLALASNDGSALDEATSLFESLLEPLELEEVTLPDPVSA